MDATKPAQQGHTFMAHPDGACTVGYWLAKRANEAPEWVPLFDVSNQLEATAAINALNGGTGSVPSFAITKWHTARTQ
jgi:hypothetical protein